MFQIGMEGITISTLTKLAKYVIPVSVSGKYHAFRMVGSDANPSPIAASNIAICGDPIMIQAPIARSEHMPQIVSNKVSFQ